MRGQPRYWSILVVVTLARSAPARAESVSFAAPLEQQGYERIGERDG